MWLQHCKPCWLGGVDVVSEIVNLAGYVVCGVNLQGYMGDKPDTSNYLYVIFIYLIG